MKSARTVALLLLFAGAAVASAFVPREHYFALLDGFDPLTYLVACAVGALILVPGAVTKTAGGLLFGPTLGIPLAFAGALVGSSAAFIAGRLMRRTLSAGAAPSRLRTLQERLERSPGVLLLLMRLSPAVPYNLLNYGIGFSRIRFPVALAASLGMLPTTAFYAYAGAVLRGTAVEPGPIWERALLLLGLLSTGALAVWMSRAAKARLDAEEGTG
ncbi:MAG: VTT domain-containing protein [Myxococcota bacterium]